MPDQERAIGMWNMLLANGVYLNLALPPATPDSRPLLRQTDLHLQATYRVPFDGVAAIQYRDGTDFQGLHSDRAMRWLDDTRIAIVVLGQRRPFVIRPRGSWVEAAASRVPAGEGPDDLVLLPGEGDLLVMGGACQRDWLHGIPAFDTANPRLSAGVSRPERAERSVKAVPFRLEKK